MKNLNIILESQQIEAFAPCRIDMGGTLDMSAFYYPLKHLSPLTFNIAIDLKTRVRLLPYKKNMVKISSKGFKSAKYPFDEVPFNHPLGLMFAIATYFNAKSVHIVIDSSSPPRSALGGSSAAAVALIAAFSKIASQNGKSLSKRQIATLAHALEESAAGIPSGMQDHLAAVYGGVNAWHWTGNIDGIIFRKQTVIKKSLHKKLKQHLLLSYCGIPHESKEINSKWIKQFLAGNNRRLWSEIIVCAQNFVNALSEQNFKKAALAMNKETTIRRKMTPDVLDAMGKKLVNSAIKYECGARFTGAGGGGCVWAIGEIKDIEQLKTVWKNILNGRKTACLLDANINSKGVEAFCVDCCV